MNTPKPSPIKAMHDLCNAMRAFEKSAPSHDDLIFVNAVYSDVLRNCGTLTDALSSVAVDLCDEITGQIEQDQIDQQNESGWLERQDLPDFEGTWGMLDALTVREQTT